MEQMRSFQFYRFLIKSEQKHVQNSYKKHSFRDPNFINFQKTYDMTVPNTS